MRGATLLMKSVVLFIGIVVLALAVILFPEILRESAMVAAVAAERISSFFAFVNYVFIAGLYGAAVPFFIVLHQTLKLLKYIDKRQAFSELSVGTLKNIKGCAIAVGALYMVGVMPLVYCFAELDDAPGLILIGMVIGFAPFVIATFAAILQKLLQEAIEVKSESELTI